MQEMCESRRFHRKLRKCHHWFWPVHDGISGGDGNWFVKIHNFLKLDKQHEGLTVEYSFTRSTRALCSHRTSCDGHVDCWWPSDIRHDHQLLAILQGGARFLGWRCAEKEWWIGLVHKHLLALTGYQIVHGWEGLLLIYLLYYKFCLLLFAARFVFGLSNDWLQQHNGHDSGSDSDSDQLSRLRL